MADNHSKEVRSKNMSHIRSTNSKPEETVRKFLFSKGLRYRKNVRKLPGCPDIVLPKYKTVIFVNGCFWHRHQGCKYAYMPKSRVEFWQKKFDDNVRRDVTVRVALREQDIKCLVVWECTIKRMAKDEQYKAFVLDECRRFLISPASQQEL